MPGFFPTRKGRYIGVGVLGYRRSRIRQLVLERDALAHEAEVQLRAAEGRILALRRELGAVRAELNDRDARINELTAQIEAFARDPERIPSTVLSEELNSILSTAQETAARMMERAKAVSERHLKEAAHFEQQLHDDLARMDEWRRQALPLIRAVQSRMGQIRAMLEEVTETIPEAVKPRQQLPDLDRFVPSEADGQGEEASDRTAVAKLGPAPEEEEEEEGTPRRTRRRSARSKPLQPVQSEDASASQVITIPGQAEAR